MISTILEGISSGAINPEPPPMIAGISLAALGIFPAMLLRRVAPVLPPGMMPEPADAAEALVDVLFRGIAPRKKHQG